LNKNIEVGLLLDYYGSLLSDTQYNLVDMYYNQDLSLSEISEITGITRQGIHDSVKRTEALLLEFEDKLKMKHTYERVKSLACDILDVLSDLFVEDFEKLSQIRNLIGKIIEGLEG
jgi:hypothetical protein